MNEILCIELVHTYIFVLLYYGVQYKRLYHIHLIRIFQVILNIICTPYVHIFVCMLKLGIYIESYAYKNSRIA